MELYDWLVIGLFCLALIGIVVWVVSKKNNDSADYFLGGRDATWIARSCRCWSIVRNGNGTLGDTGMDDTYPGMGVRAILYPFYGLHHA